MRKAPGLAAAGVLCALALPLLAHDDHHDRDPKDIFTVQPLRGGVYALYGRGGNVGFFVGPDAVVVVDAQFRDIAPGIVAKIRGVSDKPIKYLLNTHHHGDHTGGNEVFRQFAVIVGHDNVRKRMLASPADILAKAPEMLERARKRGDAETVKGLEEEIAWAKKVKVEEIATPVLTFDSEMRIHPEGSPETIHFWHTPPAHTDGDGVVFFEKANVVHMGDVFFHRVIPYIDTGAGGSPAGYLAAIDKVIARVPADALFIAGHGKTGDLAAVKESRRYVADVIEAARKAKSAGVSRDEFVRTVELPAYKEWPGYPDRFRLNCGAAYDELK